MRSEQSKLTKSSSNFWVEGLAIALGLLGTGFILAPDRLRDWLFSSFKWIKLVFTHTWAGFNQFLDRLSVTKLAGFVLLLAFLAILAWRERSRLVNSPHLSAEACPSCGGVLYRVHRRSVDRLLGRISGIPLRRYQCINDACGWRGLLRRREHHHQEHE
jgi:hypothetical protein